MEQGAEAADRARLRRWRAVLFFFASATVLWILLFRGCVALCDIKARPVWTAASPEPLPTRHFRLLGFPVSSAVPLYDESGAVKGTLTRAVMLSVEEEGADWVGVTGEAGTQVKRSDLTLEPRVGWETWIEKYGKARQTWEQKFLFARVRSERLADGGARVTFEEHWEDSITESTYLVRVGRAQPDELAFAGKGAGIEAGAKAIVVVPLLAAAGFIGTRLLRWAILGRKRVPASATSAP
jgi:hypothetical protein